MLALHAIIWTFIVAIGALLTFYAYLIVGSIWAAIYRWIYTVPLAHITKNNKAHIDHLKQYHYDFRTPLTYGTFLLLAERPREFIAAWPVMLILTIFQTTAFMFWSLFSMVTSPLLSLGGKAVHLVLVDALGGAEWIYRFLCGKASVTK